MTALVFFLERIANGIYIVLAAGFAYFFRRWLRANREYGDSPFELVRDLADGRRKAAFLGWASLLVLALGVLLLTRVVAPYLRDNPPAIAAEVTVEEPDFFTPTPQAPATLNLEDLAGGVGGPTEPPVTPSPIPTAVGTLVPDLPAAVGCDEPGALLQVPANRMLVLHTIDVIGVANDANFLSYKLELSGPGTSGSFAVISESTTPVPEPGILGQLVASAFEDGDYQFRLTVFDTSNMLTAACLVNIRIDTSP